MVSMKNRIEYILKHNILVSKLIRFFASISLRFLGLFIRIDPKTILLTGQGKKYNDSTRTIYEFMISNSFFADFTFYWAVEDLKVNIPGKCEKIKIDSLRYFIVALSSKYWIASVNIERSLRFKKRKTLYLNTWHGTPLKTIGNSASKRKDYNFSHINFFSCAGEYERNIYIRDFKLKEKSLIFTGLPRNDDLYHISLNRTAEIKKKMNISPEKKVILYAPTWRDSDDKGKTYSINPPINLSIWEKELGNDYVVLFRTHPYTNKLLGVTFSSFIMDCNDYPNVNDLLIISDILISDYSATIFDFSILERPIICFAYDYENYSKTRGLYFNLEKELPSGIQRTEEEVISKILHLDFKHESAKTRAFKTKFLQYGGHATQLCLQYLFKDFHADNSNN